MQYIKPGLITKEQLEVLQKSREIYGFKKQLSVASEELSELAIVCDKFQRYDSYQEAITALYSMALEETADVLIILNHIFEVFNFDEDALKGWISAKVDRLNRWLITSNKLEQSMVDRELPGQLSLSDNIKRDCTSCVFNKIPVGAMNSPCRMCKDEESFYISQNRCKGCINTLNWVQLAPEGKCGKCIRGIEDNYVPREG